jgi:hypothetical protein
MERFLAGNESSLQILQQQLNKAKVMSREFTGVGFFSRFEVPAEAQLSDVLTLTLGDVGAQIEGLTAGAGFVLYVRNGRLKQLEGYSYGDEPWPSNIRKFDVGYIIRGKVGEERDEEKLRQELRKSSADR